MFICKPTQLIRLTFLKVIKPRHFNELLEIT